MSKREVFAVFTSLWGYIEVHLHKAGIAARSAGSTIELAMKKPMLGRRFLRF